MALHSVVNALEFLSAADRPVYGESLDTEFVFDLIEQVKRIFRFTVHLVDKRKYRDMTHYADLEQLSCLVLNALCSVDDHYSGVRSHQCTVGILGEILMSGCVEDIDAAVLIIELENGRCY